MNYKKLMICVITACAMLGLTACLSPEEKEQASVLKEKIVSLEGKDYYSQAELDDIKNEYDSLKDEQKELVDNYDDFEKISNTPTEYEKWAYGFCTKIKERLKNPNSLQIHSISMKYNENAQYSNEKCMFEIDYSSQNGFGGMNRDTLYVSYNIENEDFFGGSLVTLDSDGATSLYTKSSYSKSTVDEITFDVERIESFLNQ